MHNRARDKSPDVTYPKLIFNIIIMMNIVRTGDIRAFIAFRRLGMMTMGMRSASLEDVCKRFPASI